MEYLKNLNKEQKQAVISNSREIMLIAGAGTGKTNTIIRKIQYLVQEKKIQASTILSVTFTNKAVNEIKERLNKYLGKNSEVVVNTFHELARTILFENENYKKIGYEKLTIIKYEEQEKIISGILERTEYFEIVNKYKYTIKKIIQDFSLRKNDLYVKSNKNDLEDLLDLVYASYNFILYNEQLIEIDDLIYLSEELLKKDEKLLEEYQNKYNYIFIDEYQDINKNQYNLIKLLNNKNNILVVGDEDQSIYSWRGSNSKYFKDFKTEYKNVEIIKLERNYRSTKEILYLANNFIKQNTDREDKNLYTDLTNKKPKLYINSDINKQVDYITNNIQEDKTTLYKNSAILVRSKNIDLMTILKTKLVENNIPYQIIGEYPLYKRKIIKDLISILKFIENKDNNYAFQRLTKVIKLGFGKVFFKNLNNIRSNLGIYSYYKIIEQYKNYHNVKRYEKNILKFIDMFKDYNNKKSFDDLIEEIIDNFFDETSNLDYSYLQEFLKEAREYHKRNGYKTIKEYLDYIEYFKEIHTKDRIQIMTMHASKGLEFEKVYILNINKEYPYLYKSNYIELDKLELKNNNIIEEERRLLYVSMTRAKRELYILGDEKSKFIQELKNINDNK